MSNIRITRSYDAYCEVDVNENPDWGYARNKQVLLKDVILEYSTSSFDAPIPTAVGVLHGGNRDFSWQGLLAGPINGELYKLLDALYYKPIDAEDLKPLLVRTWRNSANYVYVDENEKHYEVDITVRTKKNCGILDAYASRPSIFALLLDMRNAESDAQPSYSISCRESGVTIESSATPLKLNITGFDDIQRLDESLEWVYKLDDGFRTIDKGNVVFVRHVHRVYIPIALIANRGAIRIEVPLPGIKYRRRNADINGKIELAETLSASPRILKAILLRIDRLMSFGIPMNSILAPEAGAMWFKRIWTRDLLEGIRWNLWTYAKTLRLSKWLINLVKMLIKEAYEAGGLRTLIDNGEYSSDAFPQLINIAASIYELTNDKSIIREATKLMVKAYRMLTSGRGFSGCNLREGLLVCKANSSWIDVLYPCDGVKWPTRLPWAWRDKVPPNDHFALVEVNALFLECISNLMKNLHKSELKIPDELHEFKAELLHGYKKWFMTNTNLPPMTIEPTLGLKDDTKSSVSVVALAALKNILYNEKIALNLWSDLEQLLVKRKLVELGDTWEVFGLLVRKGEARPYLGDLEYHGAVVWPRDTPYLIEVMKFLSLDVYGVLINNLDHMISEGAIGYVNELFSMPTGQNPCPKGEESLNPVPVKNFAQYWSHWCDPYINYFGTRR
ncbi:MAG: hypothetical protein ACXQTI_08095 [Candidatus Nezhaarchaeales archaeon]